MPGKNRNPLLGWHCPGDLAAWARTEAERRGGRGALSGLLTEALAEKRSAIERARRPAAEVTAAAAPAQPEVTAPRREARAQPAARPLIGYPKERQAGRKKR